MHWLHHRTSIVQSRFAATVAALVASVCFAGAVVQTRAADFERLEYGQPGLVVDLGVGLWAWPLPMDFDGDGDLDLVVACPDKPSNGLYYFENPEGNVTSPVFKPAVRLGPSPHNVSVSQAADGVRVLTPFKSHPDFKTRGITDGVPLGVEEPVHTGKLRTDQWKFVDFDGDADDDLIVGIDDWQEYGWDDAFDSDGRWTNGPLRAFVYLVENAGTQAAPRYAEPRKLAADGRPIEVYGMPSPNLADFDGDGDLDLVCGEFRDALTWFENVGTRREPKFAAARPLIVDGQPLRMELCMIVPAAIDWDRDGDIDLVVGQEDGRVALVENTGKVADRMPVFRAPEFFRQQADEVKIGALATPTAVDWDGDGDDDLISGDTAGFINFVENLGANESTHGRPRWAPPVRLTGGGELIRIQAGENGSIQGPCEAKWGYTVPQVADWDHDGLLDIVLNSIWGEVVWHRNVGTREKPELATAAPIEVEWSATPLKPEWIWWTPRGKQLVTQWRTTPATIDWNQDGLVDLVMLDTEGYLALYPRRRQGEQLVLDPPERVFRDEQGQPLQLNEGRAGKSGRRKFVFTDYDADGQFDLIVDSKPNLNFWRNIGSQREPRFRNEGPMAERVLCGHDCCPTTVDFDGDGRRELLVGAEDGYLYYLPR